MRAGKYSFPAPGFREAMLGAQSMPGNAGLGLGLGLGLVLGF